MTWFVLVSPGPFFEKFRFCFWYSCGDRISFSSFGVCSVWGRNRSPHLLRQGLVDPGDPAAVLLLSSIRLGGFHTTSALASNIFARPPSRETTLQGVASLTRHALVRKKTPLPDKVPSSPTYTEKNKRTIVSWMTYLICFLSFDRVFFIPTFSVLQRKATSFLRGSRPREELVLPSWPTPAVSGSTAGSRTTTLPRYCGR